MLVRAVCIGWVAGMLAACRDGVQSSGVPTDGLTGGARAVTSTSSGQCKGAGFAVSEDPVRVDRLTAKVVDADGNPAADELAQVCGLDLCINAMTDQAGNVDVRPAASLLKPAFKYGSGFGYAQFAFGLSGSPEHFLGEMLTVKLPGRETGQRLKAGASSSSGPATLELSADAKIHFDVLTYLDEGDRTFRAALVPLSGAPRAIDPSLELVVATTPVETHFCPPAKMRVLNLKQWPAGAAVEFLVHGVSIKEEWAPYGQWAKVSEGAVSADGETVETADSGGIPVLSVIGIRRKAVAAGGLP